MNGPFIICHWPFDRWKRKIQNSSDQPSAIAHTPTTARRTTDEEEEKDKVAADKLIELACRLFLFVLFCFG